MGDLVTQDTISEEDYRAIEEAVMETARGRWFLAEYAKRNRVSETDRVLEAIRNLKSYISREHEPADTLQLRLDIVDMTQKIEQIKTEIANSGDERDLTNAQAELNVVVDETEAATSNILNAAEKIQEVAWELSEQHSMTEECEKLDALATEIYMSCSFQDLTGQRLRKVVHLFSVIEERLKKMLSLWEQDDLQSYREAPEPRDEEDTLTNGPAMPGLAQSQNAIDNMLNATETTDSKLEWAEEEDSEDLFIIDDSFESNEDVAAFQADLEEEHLQTPPNAEVMDDIADDDIQLAEVHIPEDMDERHEHIEAMHKRVAMFS